MKKFITAFIAAAGIVAYLLTRKKTPVYHPPVERSHHLTKAFSKAKQHAINS